MKRIARGLSLAAVILLAAVGARAQSDCDHFSRGTEILGNIANRYYQPDGDPKTALLSLVLNAETAEVAQALQAEQGAAAAMGAGDAGCRPFAAGLRKVLTALTTTQAAVVAASSSCATDNWPRIVEDCHDKGKAWLALDRALGADGGPLGSYIQQLQANPGKCGNDQNLAVQQQVMAVFHQNPCERDDRCQRIRIGKMREAQEELAKVQGPDAATGIIQQTRRMLHIPGDELCAPQMIDSGAEGDVWCLRDHPDWDNLRLIEAVYLESKAQLMLKKVADSVCGG